MSKFLINFVKFFGVSFPLFASFLFGFYFGEISSEKKSMRYLEQELHPRNKKLIEQNYEMSKYLDLIEELENCVGGPVKLIENGSKYCTTMVGDKTFRFKKGTEGYMGTYFQETSNKEEKK